MDEPLTLTWAKQVCDFFGVLSLYFGKLFKLILPKVSLSAWFSIPALLFPAWVWGCMMNQIGNWKELKLNKEIKKKLCPELFPVLLVQSESGIKASLGGCEWGGMMALLLSGAGLEQSCTVCLDCACLLSPWSALWCSGHVPSSFREMFYKECAVVPHDSWVEMEALCYSNPELLCFSGLLSAFPSCGW